MGNHDASPKGPLRARSEEAHAADERFRSLVERAVDLIAELDSRGHLLHASPGCREILGFEASELLNTNALDLVHPEDRRDVAAAYATLREQGRIQSTFRTLHRDGSWRWIQGTALTYRPLSGELRILAIARDLTAAKTLETALERQKIVQERIAALSRGFLALEHHKIEDEIREQLPAVAELAGADRATLVVAGGGHPPPGTIYYWERPGTSGPAPRHDAAIARDFRWSMQTLGRGEVIHVPTAEALPPEAAEERADMLHRGVKSLLALALRSRNRAFGYLIFECVNQHRRWTEQEITQLRLVGEIFASAIKRKQSEGEIAQRRIAELRVAALSRRFLALGPDEIEEAIQEALAEAADLAGADRSYLYVVPAQGRAEPACYEWCAEGLTSSPPSSMMPWSTRKILAGEVFQIVDPAKLPVEAAAERQALESAGVRSVLGIPVRSGNETIGLLAFQCTHERRAWSEQDITLLRMIGDLFTAALRRQRDEEALRESRAQLFQAQKLEAVGRLAGGIAHDFNNLLTVILGFSRPLLNELEDGDPIREDIAEIHASAERAAALTRQLLTFSRRQTLVPQPIDLKRTLAGLEQLLHRLLGEDIDLVMELEPDSGLVQIDPNQLEQVVMNLAVNARDAMPDGGSLRLRTEHREIDALEARRLGLAEPGAYAMLTVTDSGCGMDEQTRAHIFDPFFTTKEPGKGTGLGLSIVYSVIEQAGGSIAAKGQPAKGSAFEIYLPRIDADADAANRADQVPTRAGSECVLVVEDEPAVRRLARRILEEHGYRVLEAGDGEEALEVAQECLDRIDVLLTDVVMPKLGGGELARRLCQRRPELKVLFTSGYPREHRDQRSPPLPDGGFLEKPFGKEDLLTKLRETLEG